MELTRRHALQGAAAALVTGGVGLSTATTAEAAFATLKPGMKGARVKDLQTRLSRLGYWLGGIDGVYGNLTTQAVMALQKAAGIGRDGVTGPVTWSKLVAGVRPKARSGSGKWIEINKARQLLLYVVNGKVLKAFNTSTGSGQRYYSRGSWHTAVTPAGQYRVFRHVRGWDSGPLGKLYAPKYFNGGIAVHGYSSVPAYAASHGCCRVSIPAMNLFWGSSYPISIGTRVWVY